MARQPKWLRDYQRELRNAKRRAATLQRNTGLIADFTEVNRPDSARDARRVIRQLQNVSSRGYQQNRLPDFVYGISTFTTPWGDSASYRFTAKQYKEIERLERRANEVRGIVGLEQVDYSAGRSFTSPEGLQRYITGLQNQGNLKGALGKRRQFVENYIQGLETAKGGDVDVFIDRIIAKVKELGVGNAASMLQASIEAGINLHVFVFASDQTLISLNIAQIAKFWGVDLRE